MNQQQMEHVVTIPPDTNSLNTHDGQSSFQRWQHEVIDIIISVLWIIFEIVTTTLQIILLTIMVSYSTHDHEHTQLFKNIWVGYMAGCLAAWSMLCSFKYRTNYAGRFQVVVERLQIVLLVIFAIWVIVVQPAVLVGVAWMYCYTELSLGENPSLLWLSSSIFAAALRVLVYAIPLICSVAQCRIISNHAHVPADVPVYVPIYVPTHVGFDAPSNYQFKAKISDCNTVQANEEESSNFSDSEPTDGGILAAGTEKERPVSAEDAECCICLGKYRDGVELRELPCTHHFHLKCVDEWLRIKASCPLCKHEPSYIW